MPGAEAAATPPRRIPATPLRWVASISALFVILFLFLRHFLIEPFGVPTGSMAPALIGNHRETACIRCGHPVIVGANADGEFPVRQFVRCPNCGQPTDLADALFINGDRVLVDKNVYHLRSPRRWEVAVFHCRDDLSKPYVKRVVGLPGEVMTIVDGDVLAGGMLLRKSLVEMRESRIPFFDMAYRPKPDGWGKRWLVYPAELDPRLPRLAAGLPQPAGPEVLTEGSLVLDASAGLQNEVRLEYRHWDFDDEKEVPVLSSIAYEGSGSTGSNIYSVHDFFLSCEIEVLSGGEGSVFACRLFDGTDAVAAEISVGGRKDNGHAHVSHEKLGGLASERGITLKPGQRYAFEMAFIDRRVVLAVDRREVVEPVDLPHEANRGGVRRPLQLGARGCKLVIRELKLYRDIHYTQAGIHGTREPARLGPDEYFLLGDNSANSQDSREWSTPGVPERDFIGKPFLIHQPLKMGRMRVGGREQTYQSVDWTRLRWLH